MAKVKEKKKALRLRRKGESIKDIARELGVSRGSVSLWCQDIILTKSQKNKLKQKQIIAGAAGRAVGAEANKQKRLQRIILNNKKGTEQIKALSQRDLLLLGLGLYWGEGIKSRSGMAAIVNSDPEVISIGKQWFETCLGVQPADFRPYVYISSMHETRKNKIISFWSHLLRLPQKSFKVIILKDRPKKRYENHEKYYGVIHLRIKKSTELKYRIMGLIRACQTGR